MTWRDGQRMQRVNGPADRVGVLLSSGIPAQVNQQATRLSLQNTGEPPLMILPSVLPRKQTEGKQAQTEGRQSQTEGDYG